MSLPTLCYDLPRYSPSGPVPDYSFEPACDERILEHTPRSVRPTPESTFVEKAGKTTVVLHNQEENATTPTYGRAATISGCVLFDSGDRICEVVLKILGKLEITSSEGGARTTTLVNNKYILWSDSQKKEQCPSQLCFSVRLPSTFRDCEENRALPPSFLVDIQSAPMIFVRSGYLLKILIAKRRSQKVGFLTKTKRVTIPFEYLPRTRPHRPIVPPLCFFSDVKSTPEEWHQTIAPIKTPANAKLGPIFAQLFVPASRIYGIRDVIPFHVQLNGPEDSLRAYLQPKSQQFGKNKRPKSADYKTLPNSSVETQHLRLINSVPGTFRSFTTVAMAPSLPTSSQPLPATSPPSPTSPSQPTLTPFSFSFSSPSPSSSGEEDITRPTLRVFLLRQISIDLHGSGKKAWRNQILGEATLRSVPPLLSSSRFSSYGADEPSEEDHLDWEGELKINEQFTVGGWQAGNVHVKDFIALSVAPQNERTSTLYGIQLTVPVKLVTDPWAQSGLGPGQFPPEAQ